MLPYQEGGSSFDTYGQTVFVLIKREEPCVPWAGMSRWLPFSVGTNLAELQGGVPALVCRGVLILSPRIRLLLQRTFITGEAANPVVKFSLWQPFCKKEHDHTHTHNDVTGKLRAKSCCSPHLSFFRKSFFGFQSLLRATTMTLASSPVSRD